MIDTQDENKKAQQGAAAGVVVAAAMPPAHTAGLPEPVPAEEHAEISATTWADPATAALTAGQGEEAQQTAATPEDEQEDPYAGRDLPEEPPTGGEDEASSAKAGTPELPLSTPPVEPAAAGGTLPPAAAASSPRLASRVASTPGLQEYWRSVLTGSAETVPAAVRQRAGADDAALNEEEREYRLLSTINRSWAADHLGLSREQVRANWANLRSRLAKQFHVADDEQELFTALSFEAQDAPRRAAVVSLYEKHYRAALLGQAVVEEAQTAASPVAEHPSLPYADGLAEEARRRGEAQRRRYLPLASELAEGLGVYAAMEEDAFAAPRVLSSVPELTRSIEALAELETAERQHVYAIAQGLLRQRREQAGEEESLYRTMLRAARRGAVGVGMGVGQALANASIASLHSMGSMLGETYGRPLREGAAKLDLRARIAEETRRLLQDDIAPLDVSAEAGLAGQLMVDAAGATPSAIAACCGGAGFATIGLSGVGEAVAAARQRAPEGRQWLQYLAGVLGGGLQATIYSGMSRVGGQLLSNSIGRLARASGKGAREYSVSSLGVLGAMGFEEAKLLFTSKAAEGASLGTQELAARLERTASNIDWSEFGDNAQDLELNMREAAMNLPFILIASGRLALRHFRSRHAVLGEGKALLDWGISESTKDAIMKEANIDRQSTMLRDALRSSKRWSAPGFLAEAARALRLLNTDYYQGFKDPQAVIDFLRLPAENSIMPRPPFVEYSTDNPAHMQELIARHGKGEKINPRRLADALKLRDEWWQKAHIVKTPTERADGEAQQAGQGAGRTESGLLALPAPEGTMPTPQRRQYFGLELLRMDSLVPPRMRPGGFYAPYAEAERAALLRDRVAELHDLSYQLLLTAFPLDSLTHSTRGIEHQRRVCETSRLAMVEAVGNAVMRRVTGSSEYDAMEELGEVISGYFGRRRYSSFPPGWMTRVRHIFTKNLVEAAMATSTQEELPDSPPELLDAYRVALGFKACAKALYELLPTTADFQTALSRGMSPARAYIHMLSRELGVDFQHSRKVISMLGRLGEQEDTMITFRGNDPNIRQFREFSDKAVEAYRQLTGCEYETEKVGANGGLIWRLRRPNGQFTRWHRRRSDVVSDFMANAAFIFMPYRYDRTKPLRHPKAGQTYDLLSAGRAKGWQYTGYDQLCREALRDTARSWMETTPYAQPGFELGQVQRYLYIGGRKPSSRVLLREGADEDAGSVTVDNNTLSSPLRLVQARFHTYWWRQLSSGLLSADEAGQQLVKLRIITPEELVRVKDIAKPLLMPRRKDVPLRLTPPPDIPGMNRAMAEHLTEFSLRYFLTHLDDMPLPLSAREWFKLAPLCPLRPGKLPEVGRRLSLKRQNKLYTCWANRMAARELKAMGPAVADMRRAEREGLLINNPLMPELRTALGLNPAQNYEQAWCARNGGISAFKAIGQTYWHLLQNPHDGWKLLTPDEQQSLRDYVDGICRTESSPEAMEAEARGESPDYVLSGLQNLQDVLRDYPNLRQYDLTPEKGQPSLRPIILEKFPPVANPLAEPEYEPLPPYTGGSMKLGFTLGKAMEPPAALLQDSRVLPAMHLLGALRSYPASRPFARYDGIQWQGELYGGTHGRRPAGLEGTGWVPAAPLEGLVSMLQRVDELKSTLPEGKELQLFEQKLDGLGDELDLSLLRNVTLYRSITNPAHVYRLMPGEPDAANPNAQRPYITHSIGGTYFYRHLRLMDPQELHHAYMPLERFRMHKVRFVLENTREQSNRESLEHTLSGVLSSTMRMASQSNPRGSLAGMRELLMRFAEDSGFSESLRELDPRELTYGQVLTLKLARELLLCVCGNDPESAYRRLIRLSHRVRRSDSIRGTVLRALGSATETLYGRGARIFSDRQFEDMPRPEKKKKKTTKFYNDRMSEEDINALDAWLDRQDKRSFEESDIYMESHDNFFEGYNDHLRSDGYSRGFFD